MPRVITLDKGSKRRLRAAIRWTVGERITAIVFFMLLAVFCLVVALYAAYYFSDEDPGPRLELRR